FPSGGLPLPVVLPRRNRSGCPRAHGSLQEHALMRSEASVRPAAEAVRICQAALNILVVLLFLLSVYASYQHFLNSRSIQSFGILAVSSLFLGLCLAGRRAVAESPSLPLWLLAVAGTALPLLLRPSDAPGLVRPGTV